MYGLDLFLRLLLAALGGLGDLLENGLFAACVVQARKLVLHAVYGSRCGHAAVAYGGVHLVKARVRDLFQQLRQDLLVGDIGHAQALVFKLGLEHCVAALDVLLAALFFEPLLYLRACRTAFCDIEPVAARPGCVF